MITENKKQCAEMMLATVKKIVEVWDGLPEEDKVKELGQARVAICSMDTITSIFQKMTDEQRNKLIEVEPEMRKVFTHALAYLDLGLTFGYTELAKDKK